MLKLISFLLLFSSLVVLPGCESHRNEGIQEEQERPHDTVIHEIPSAANRGDK